MACQQGNRASLAGRPKGSRNKRTIDGEAYARAIMDDPEVRAQLLKQAQTACCPRADANVLSYAFGKPVEVVDVGNGDSRRARSKSPSKPAGGQLPPLREHQRALYDHRQRFNVWVCHRRFGKTVLALYQLIADAYANTRPAPATATWRPSTVRAR